MFRDKILPKNVRELFEEDLYWHGLDYVKKVYNIESCIKTKGNDFRIYLDRVNSDYEDPRYDYICTMKFVDRLGSIIADIKFSEVFAFTLVDFICDFADSDNITDAIKMSSGESDMSYYVLNLDREESNEIIHLYLYKTSPIYYTNFNVLNLDLEDSDALYDIGEAMYFSYLSDIDDGIKYKDILTPEGVKYIKI